MRTRPRSSLRLRRRHGRSETLLGVCMANRTLREALQQALEHPPSPGGEVLANIGHELRTPLTIIQGLSEILLDDLEEGRLEAERHRQFLGEIHQASLALGKLVETSILLTKLQAGPLEVHLQPVSVREAIERVTGQYGAEIRAKHLLVSFDQDEEIYALADGMYLELILQALIDNSIKFNQSCGSIAWRVRYDRALVRITLLDTGIGIAPDKLDELFQVFTQGEQGPTRRWGGLGLGLPLVSRLLECQRGRIEAQSEGPYQGARFVVFLRRAYP